MRSALPSLSVVIPTYNSSEWLPETIALLRAALARAEWTDAEIVVVDDGSTDDTSAVLAQDVGLPAVTVVRQENSGRFRARESGLRIARGEMVLLIDSRVHAHPDSLRFLAEQLTSHADRRVWNGHVHTAVNSSPYSAFWDGIAFLAWRRYLRAPSLTSYGAADYDYFPKGTTFFAAPRQMLLDACDRFQTSYTDLSLANDDTLLIRPLAAIGPIFLSPDFSCTYFPRDTARSFLRHAFHRGTVFVDGYFRPGTRFYRPLQAALALAPVAVIVTARKPAAALGAVATVTVGLGATASVLGAPKRSARSLALLAPTFTVAYGSGIVRGLLMRHRSRNVS